ncbi:hypothetical protein NQZ68_030838, partial [Dissostichus eleginoides]
SQRASSERASHLRDVGRGGDHVVRASTADAARCAERLPRCVLVPLPRRRMGGDAEHHHHTGTGGAARAREVHQLQRPGAGLHTGGGRGPQQRPVHPDPRGP